MIRDEINAAGLAAKQDVAKAADRTIAVARAILREKALKDPFLRSELTVALGDFDASVARFEQRSGVRYAKQT